MSMLSVLVESHACPVVRCRHLWRECCGYRLIVIIQLIMEITTMVAAVVILLMLIGETSERVEQR